MWFESNGHEQVAVSKWGRLVKALAQIVFICQFPVYTYFVYLQILEKHQQTEQYPVIIMSSTIKLFSNNRVFEIQLLLENIGRKTEKIHLKDLRVTIHPVHFKNYLLEKGASLKQENQPFNDKGNSLTLIPKEKQILKALIQMPQEGMYSIKISSPLGKSSQDKVTENNDETSSWVNIHYIKVNAHNLGQGSIHQRTN